MTDDEILAAILLREGGYNDDPTDRGGATHYGITQSTLSLWRGRQVTKADVQALTVEEAKTIYRAKYLAPFAEAPTTLKPQLVDIAVLSGVGTARQLWTKAGNSNVRLFKERIFHLAKLVQKDARQSKFIHGWLRRACEFLSDESS